MESITVDKKIWGKGTVINNELKIEELIKKTSFELTYRCSCHNKESIILKIPKSKKLKEQEKFVDFGMSLQKNQHPNIISIKDVFAEKGLWMISMPDISGINLKDMIKKKGFLSPTEALSCINQIGEGLSFLHNQKIVHQNIKPENIIISSFDNLKATLIEFDWSEGQRVIDNYTPPEQMIHKKKEKISDIYSLAGVLYYSLTGLEPISASLREKYNIHLIAPATINHQVNDGLSRGILEGMNLLRADRPSTIKEWLKIINREE